MFLDVCSYPILQVCIWDYYGRRKHALMNDMDKTLDDVNIQMDQDVSVAIPALTAFKTLIFVLYVRWLVHSCLCSMIFFVGTAGRCFYMPPFGL